MSGEEKSKNIVKVPTSKRKQLRKQLNNFQIFPFLCSEKFFSKSPKGPTERGTRNQEIKRTERHRMNGKRKKNSKLPSDEESPVDDVSEVEPSASKIKRASLITHTAQ